MSTEGHRHRGQSVVPIPFRGCVAGFRNTHNQRAHRGAAFVHLCSCGVVMYQNTRFPFSSEKGPWHRPEIDVDWPHGVDWIDWTKQEIALYATFDANSPICLDLEETAAVEAKVEGTRADLERSLSTALKRAASNGNVIPKSEIWAEFESERGQLPLAATALLDVAERRYLADDLARAADTCVKAIGLAANASGYADFQEACAWHLLARLHASAGRFSVAAAMLDSAESVARTGSLRQTGPLESAWPLAVASLREDIAEWRMPLPSRSIFVPTRVSGYRNETWSNPAA